MRRLTAAVVGLCAPALLAAPLGCGSGPAPPADPAPGWFRDDTAAAHLAFTHDAGPGGKYFLPEIMGSGAAVLDFDADGRLDVYLITNAGPGSKSTNRLLRRMPDGTFNDVSAGSGLDVAGHGMGAAVGDIDNDGFPDLLLTEYGRLRLFRNNGGNGTFADVGAAAGVASPLWSTSAAFADFDRDGWLDLAVGGYVDYDRSAPCSGVGGRPDFCHPKSYPGTVTKLFRNLGADPAKRGTFRDVSVESGVGRVPGPALGVLWADFDGDGWPDLFVANDAAANRLWVNRRDGTFADEAPRRGLAFDRAGNMLGNMGVAWGDADGDGLSDLFVTHLTEETHTLWRQGPRGSFRDATGAARLAEPAWRGTGFGTAMLDLDNDGDLDIVAANGRVARPAAHGQAEGFDWSHYAERNQLFLNTGDGTFADAGPENGVLCGPAAVWRGLAYADFDDDGGIDLLLTAAAGPAKLFANAAPDRGHWVGVRAVDPALNRDAYGALVTVTAGGRSWGREVNPGSSYLCSNDPRVHFGLGSATPTGLAVRWPNGDREEFDPPPAGRYAVVKKGTGRPAKGQP
jgi:hypothetical protein